MTDPRNSVQAIKSVKSGLYSLCPEVTADSDIQSPKIVVDLGALKGLNKVLTNIISQTKAK